MKDKGQTYPLKMVRGCLASIGIAVLLGAVVCAVQRAGKARISYDFRHRASRYWRNDG